MKKKPSSESVIICMAVKYGGFQQQISTQLNSFHPETPDEKLLVSDSESGGFSPGKEIEGLRGGVGELRDMITGEIVVDPDCPF